MKSESSLETGTLLEGFLGFDPCHLEERQVRLDYLVLEQDLG